MSIWLKLTITESHSFWGVCPIDINIQPPLYKIVSHKIQVNVIPCPEIVAVAHTNTVSKLLSVNVGLYAVSKVINAPVLKLVTFQLISKEYKKEFIKGLAKVVYVTVVGVDPEIEIDTESQ